MNCTPTTPTLSDAAAVSFTVPLTAAWLAGAVTETVGGVVSGTFVFETVMVTTAEIVEFPAASLALAVMEWEPLDTDALFHALWYGAVFCSEPVATPSIRNCTPATPTLSEAVAARFTVPVSVLPAAGAVRETVGGTLSWGLGEGELAAVPHPAMHSAAANAPTNNAEPHNLFHAFIVNMNFPHFANFYDWRRTGQMP